MSDPQSAIVSPPAGGTGPLGELALSFSGGGYRAAAFHLGALRILQRTGLLRDVVALSTVSGGSIVGAAWVLSVLRGERYDEFDRRFAEFLQKTNVIRDALDHLTAHREHGHPSYPSLIRSAARVYAGPGLFGDTRLGDIDLRAQQPSGDRPRFREIIFNSTEFRTGIDFRFRRSVNPRAAVGNGSFRVPREVAGRIRVADAVAASSCFPGGFEPFLFPAHFAWPADFPLEQAKAALGPKFTGGLPLMDGGIWDNQGVDSLVLAFKRGGAATLVISDVSARNRDIYDFPPAGRRGFVTLRMVSILGWLLFLAAVLSAGMLAWTGLGEWGRGERGWMQVFLYTVPFVFSAAVVAAMVWLRITLSGVQERLKATVQIPDVWKDLHRLTVLEAVGMIQLRVGSLLALTSSIFMKRIRGLIVDSVYKDPAYKGKRMMNLIYSLDENRPKLYAAHPWLEPSPALRQLAKEAEAFPTTLWFDAPGQMEMVARAGEATLCFILLQFIVEKRAEQLADPDSPSPGCASVCARSGTSSTAPLPRPAAHRAPAHRLDAVHGGLRSSQSVSEPSRIGRDTASASSRAKRNSDAPRRRRSPARVARVPWGRLFRHPSGFAPPSQIKAHVLKRLFASLLLVTVLAACDGDGPTDSTPGTPASVKATAGDGQSGTVGAQLPAALSVTVTDASGKPVAGYPVGFRVLSGGGTLSDGAVVTSAGGTAATRWTLGNGRGASRWRPAPPTPRPAPSSRPTPSRQPPPPATPWPSRPSARPRAPARPGFPRPTRWWFA